MPRKIPLSVAELERQAKKAEKFSKKVSEVWHKKRVPISTDNKHFAQRFTTVRRNGKVVGCIAYGVDKYSVLKSGVETFFDLVYYPSPKYIKDFVNASRGVRKTGPSEKYLGAVGSLYAVMRKRFDEKFVRLSYIQAHYKTGSPSEGHLSRSIATKHGGWRERLLEEFFKTIKKEGVGVVSYQDQNPSSSTIEQSKTIIARQSDFIKIARKYNYRVEEKVMGGSGTIELTATKND